MRRSQWPPLKHLVKAPPVSSPDCAIVPAPVVWSGHPIRERHHNPRRSAPAASLFCVYKILARHITKTMPKQIPQKQLDVLLQAVARFPEGPSIEEVSNALEAKLPRRTFQRRLALLVRQKRLTAWALSGWSVAGRNLCAANFRPLTAVAIPEMESNVALIRCCLQLRITSNRRVAIRRVHSSNQEKY